MSGLLWARIRSWHLVIHALGVPTGRTACGRELSKDAPVSDTIPSNEKSCESCLRALAAEDAKDRLPEDGNVGE